MRQIVMGGKPSVEETETRNGTDEQTDRWKPEEA